MPEQNRWNRTNRTEQNRTDVTEKLIPPFIFFYHHLSCSEGQDGDWNQLSQGKGRVQPGQVASLSQDWHREANKHTHSHMHTSGKFRVVS